LIYEICIFLQALREPTDKRVFVLAAALKEGWDIDTLYSLTKIDKWFLYKLKNITDFQTELEKIGEKNGNGVSNPLKGFTTKCLTVFFMFREKSLDICTCFPKNNNIFNEWFA
jgi:hypothetical protein